MIKIPYSVLGLLVLLVACKSERETPNGLKYTVVKTGDGTIPKKNEILVFDYQMKDSKDSVWGDTFKDGVPAATLISDSSKLNEEDGMTQMFRQLSKGDSVKTTMTVSEFFKKLVRGPVPPNVDSTRSVTYFISVRDIMERDKFFNFRAQKVNTRDDRSIDQYLKDNKIEAKQDTSGLRYVIHNSNGKEKPTVNNCVEVMYTGRFLKNGQVFDSNQVSFWLGQVIRGWQLGIPMLGKGDSATFYIPSRLGYGPDGPRVGLPADAALIFDVRLLNIKEFDSTTGACK